MIRRAAHILQEAVRTSTNKPRWFAANEIDGIYAGKKTVVRADTTYEPRWSPRRIASVGQTRPHIGANAEANIVYIALVDPTVGNALAGLLYEAAGVYEGVEEAISRGVNPDELPVPSLHALSTARAILREG